MYFGPLGCKELDMTYQLNNNDITGPAALVSCSQPPQSKVIAQCLAKALNGLSALQGQLEGYEGIL